MLLAQGFDDEIMPCWLPPSPPMSDNEFDMKMEDDGFDLIYELDPMNEAQLPSQIYELRRPLSEKQKQKEPTLGDILTQNQRVEVRDAVEKCLQFPSEIEPAAAAASPAYTENSFSLDESSQDARPDAELSRTVTSAQLSQRTQKRRSQQRMKNYEVGVKRATTPPKADREEHDYDGAEWSIIEDFCLLQAVQSEMTNSHDVEKVHVPVHPKRRNDGMMLNWEYVASTVNKTTRFYRSARQCSIRYQMFVRPKELGQLVTSDPISKKTVKVELSSNELAHLRKGRITTESQYLHDCSTILDKRHFNRFKMVKLIAQKKNPPFWRGPKETRRLDSLLGKMPASYEEKLNNINYGVILDAEAVAWVPESEMTVNDVQKKKVEKPPAPRAPSPTPRAHHVYRRNYAMPPSKNAEVLPKRKEMYIPVPELHIPQPPPRLQHTVSSQAISSMDHGHQMVQQQQQPQQLTQAQSQHQQHHQIIQQPMREQSVGQHLIQVQQHNQATLQRRTASMANVQTHYIQQSGVMNQGQGQSYVVVNSPASSGPNEGGVQHTTSVQQGQRITQYVNPQQIQQQSGNPRGGPMYTSNPQMVVQTANRGAPQRVMRGGANRMIVQQSGERQAYVMQQSQPVRVRVLPTAQRVVQQPGIGQRRAVHPQPGTVAAMVLPNRVGGTQLRNIPRPYQGQAGRIHVNVGPQNQRLQQGPGRTMTTAHVVTSGQGVSRQVMGPGRPLPSLGSRVDSPQTQTVAQVVLAPPSSNVSSSSTGSTMNSQAPPVLHSQPRQAIIVQSEQSHAAHSTAGHPATSQHSQQPSQPQPQSVQQQPPLQQSQPQSSAPQQNQ